jgi:peptidoglycan/LPS O-acetylase OafA/YrhL
MVDTPGSPERARPARVPALDGLRGVLAVVVLGWHVATPFGLGWMLFLANLATAMFFLMTGYVLTRSWNGRYGAFLLRRFVRLWPVYAACLAVGYVIAGVRPVWSEFFWYPFMDPNVPPFIDPPVWSLFIEAWAMPLMPLVVWAGTGPTMRLILAMAALILAGLAEPRLLFGVLFLGGAFLAGVDWRNRLLESALPQWLGKVSYSLYLSHCLVLTVAISAFGRWGGVAAIPAAFGVAWIVWRLLEDPSARLSQRIGRGPRRAPGVGPQAAIA